VANGRLNDGNGSSIVDPIAAPSSPTPRSRSPQELNFPAFGGSKRILYVDAQRTNHALNFCGVEQGLHRARVACLLVDDGCLGSAQRMGSVIALAQSTPVKPYTAPLPLALILGAAREPAINP
jgi:hypothetical protein